jgi:hypothetical protein
MDTQKGITMSSQNRFYRLSLRCAAAMFCGVLLSATLAGALLNSTGTDESALVVSRALRFPDDSESLAAMTEGMMLDDIVPAAGTAE